MSTALPSELYADPRVILERAEEGDQQSRTRQGAAGCLECAHARRSVDGWPCAINCMPSDATGRCACWASA